MSDHDDVLDYLIAPTSKPKTKETQGWARINAAIDALNQEFSMVMHGSTVGVLHVRNDGMHGTEIRILSRRDFLTWQEAHNFTHPEDADKKINIGKNWLESPKKRKYVRLVFSPGFETNEDEYNLWTGFTFEPTEHGDCSLFLDHIRANICNGNAEHFHWVMCWMADLIQRPGRKPGVALVLRGGEGTGKGVFADMFGELISRHYMAITNPEHIVGRFNSHLANKILVFMDEAACSGDKKNQGIIYGLVTEPTAAIELKGKDVAPVQNFLRLILSSNHNWMVPANIDARRWAVFDVADHAKQNEAYFIEIKNQLRNGGFQKLMEILMHWDIDISLRHSLPKTAALLDQKIASFSSEKLWWLECLISGEIEMGGWPFEIKKETFHKKYEDWCRSRQIKNIVSKIAMGKSMGLLAKGCFTPKDGRVIGDFYQVASLEQCRDSFDAAMGQPYKWEE